MAEVRVKTNAMRILDAADVEVRQYAYDHPEGFVDGVTVAGRIGQPVEKVYKTLVAQGASRSYYVFVVPVAKELDLKAAARAVDEKAVELIKVTDIEKVTGYIRGGCSPIGMKKDYPTVIDSDCQALDTIIVSAGKVGFQMEINAQDLIKVSKCKVEKITFER